ncbi:hypothetical protein B0H13DRAFT_2373717 [Mycena leptocephala]|nr:hypothetical protein B0H13DRAFT_2373717 [Mycena leptocephala]
MADESEADLPDTSGPSGMQRGYALSEMADLQREFLRETESSGSVFSRVKVIVSKKSLDARDIHDRGIDRTDPKPRFALETGFAIRVQSTITDMQDILRRAALMVPGRSSWFVIDPQDALLPILNGAHDLDEINAAWLALHRRMQLAQSFLEKYEQNFQVSEENMRATSPVSTNPEVYNRWPATKPSSVQLMYLFDNVRHHHAQLLKGYDRDTDDLLHHLRAPEHLRRAFPERGPEDYPSTVYYSSSGERMERIHPSQPELESKEETYSMGAPVTVTRIGRADHVVEHLGLSDEDREEEEVRVHQVPVESEYWKGPNTSQASLADKTPFKSPNQFFLPRSPSSLNKNFRIPGPDLPDPLRGMASSSYGLSTESISQAMRTHRSQLKADPRYQHWSSTQPLPRIPGVSPIEEEEIGTSSHLKGKGKEAPSVRIRDPRAPDGSKGFNTFGNSGYGGKFRQEKEEVATMGNLLVGGTPGNLEDPVIEEITGIDSLLIRRLETPWEAEV